LPAPFFWQHHGIKATIFKCLNDFVTHSSVAALFVRSALNEIENLIGYDGLMAAHAFPLFLIV
jgi:hypothetical protein